MRSRLSRSVLAALALWLAAAGLALAPGEAAAQANVGGLAGAGEGPLEIEADEGIEWRRNEQVYIASGNAMARRGGIAVFADRLIAHYRDREGAGDDAENGDAENGDTAGGDTAGGAGLGGTEIYRVEAEGNVRIEGERQTAYGDHGRYDMDRAVVVLTGEDLRLVTEEETVTARDSLEYWQAEELAVARGDAEAVQGERSIRAEVLQAHFGGGAEGEGADSIQRIEAFENVRLATADELATGDRGVYDAVRRVATLYGDVRMTRGQNQLNGGYAEVDLESGVSRLLAAPPDGEGGQRVRGLLRPDEAEGAPDG